MRLTDEQLDRMADRMLAEANKHLPKPSPHAHLTREELLVEMDTADGIMSDMAAAIDRGVVYRKTLFGIIAAQAVVIAGLVWRLW